MKTTLSALALCAALGLSSAASAQVPSGGGGSDAKGNAPLKHAHTVNDGGARRGHTSFTEGQARQHILKAGYASVTGLAKGKDGVWRGTAMKDGVGVPVGMDFKGNVSEGAAAGPMAAPQAMPMASSSTTTTSTSTAAAAPEAATAPMPMADHARARHHRRRHHARNRCAHPSPNGAACSGIDRNGNGISDKEDRAIKGGARP